MTITQRNYAQRDAGSRAGQPKPTGRTLSTTIRPWSRPSRRLPLSAMSGPKISPELQRRISAAAKVLPYCADEEERWDLLLAIVAPRDERLTEPWPEPTQEERAA